MLKLFQFYLKSSQDNVDCNFHTFVLVHPVDVFNGIWLLLEESLHSIGMNQLLQANFIYPLKSKNHIFHTKTKILHEFIFSRYTVCIRRLHGFCCVQYQVCETGGFSLDGNSAIANTADTGIVCTTDYIDIQGKIFLMDYNTGVRLALWSGCSYKYSALTFF